jgi:hypothetical protein
MLLWVCTEQGVEVQTPEIYRDVPTHRNVEVCLLHYTPRFEYIKISILTKQMKDPSLCVFLFTISISLSQAVSYYYYTSGSSAINSDACPVSLCTQCATDGYNEGCGMDANQLNPQNCQECVGLPANAYWLPWGAYPDGIASNSSICRSTCNSRFRYDELGNCVLENCTVTVSNAELTV